MWNARLEELGKYYGCLPVHDGLWESAHETSHDLLARLSIVCMTHEAHGLDASVKISQQLASTYRDQKSKKLLDLIERDELDHVRKGVYWHKYLCEKLEIDPIKDFHSHVLKHFRSAFKGKMNHEARLKAGFTEEYYMPFTPTGALWKQKELAMKEEKLNEETKTNVNNSENEGIKSKYESIQI